MNNFHLINNKMNETFLEFKLNFKTLNFYKKFYLYLLSPWPYNLLNRERSCRSMAFISSNNIFGPFI